MKRRAIQTLMFLLLGAIVNVAVAWGFSLGEPWPSHGFQDIINDIPTIASHYKLSIPTSAAEWYDQGYASRGRGNVLTFETIVEVETQQVIIITKAGWPLRALGGLVWSQTLPGQAPTLSMQCAIEISPSIRGRSAVGPNLPSVLPLEPLWPGFAINTLFYAAVLWVLFFAPGAVRRTIRRRRGRCPACAYPVGTSPVCTECGATDIHRAQPSPSEPTA